MNIIINPERKEWTALTARNIPADDPQVTEAVERIVAGVREGGDKALRDYARQFDGAEIDSLLVSDEEIAEAIARVPAEVARAIDSAAANISAFHRAQLPAPVEVETAPGVRCMQRAVPIQRVGLYIPGGRAPLFSTVLMLAIPARLAGCPEVIMCTPASGSHPISPEILYAARVAGVDRVYKVGGAQAIAAMAYGTESIARVDKIFGPGNRFVTKAKQLVSTVTAIDMPAGPSEVMIMADATASPAFVAADMLSQAEHGPDSQAIALCDSPRLASAVAEEVERQTALLSRRELVEGSLSRSRIIVLPSREDMTEFANLYASEHLIISMSDPWDVASHITSAGSVFIGNYSPESAGDYASGTNHTLPTGGWARSMSGVNIDSYMRKITFQELTADGLRSLAPVITAMATAEGLDAHAAAVTVRLG
ncbi:histidinol dehydrogenase [uncultured Duncaniella sp.]|jgi:histidinol dehydrogenase|uniref:histidinol dehydrogenase n=1 Tax=uncultured Duncaniella sp. TaxID=2768039 RepID=UPI0026743F2B|nr:histidinol dehydrogenase [uncultured Duncaniella sp.]MCI9171762.1 histidinol dehydrogenase [Muribaculaceae bacterium]